MARRLLKIMTLLIVTLSVGAIVAIQLTKRPIASQPPSVPAPVLAKVDPQASAGVRFAIALTGQVGAPEASVFEGGSWFRTRMLGHAAMLICHPDGLIIFDTGLGRDIDKQFGAFPLNTRLMMKFEPMLPLVDQTGFKTFCPGRTPEIYLSHLHWDHAGGIEDFAETPVWIIPGAVQTARTGGVRHGYLPEQLDDQMIRWQDLTFPDGAVGGYARSRDIFGDGTAVLVPMAGHTAGSVGLILAIGARRLFLTGDTTWAVEGFARPAHKFALMRSLVDADLPTLESELHKVMALMAANPDLIVIPAHDRQAYPDWALLP